MTHKDFLKRVLKFLKQTGMSRTAFGVGALKDSNFVADLEQGRSVSLKTYERVTKFMDRHSVDAEG